MKQHLNIGKNFSYCTPCLDGLFPGLVTIGDDCIVAPNARILTHDACRLALTGEYVIEPTTIGNSVYIGYGAVVMPGITIGDRSVVGANAVVTHDVPSGVVVAGVPAKQICTVEEMLAKKRPTFKPPFDTANLDAISLEDVELFREQVYAAHRPR